MKRTSPKVEKYILKSAKDEFLALLLFCRHQWYVVVAIALAVGLALYYVSPFPPSTIRVASGQPNSTLEKIAARYGEYFAAHGVNVEFFTTRGAAENLQALREGKVDVAFSQGGLPLSRDEAIVSLGSIGYQPLWFFHRGERFTGEDFVTFLEGKRISIALPGSGTRPVVDALFGVLPEAAVNRIRKYEMPAGESIDALLAGEIDGMFLLAGIESGNAQRLLRRSHVHLLDFPVAEALTRHLEYTEVVTLPKGGLEVTPPRPEADVHMIATTTTILARESLHPALQYLFMRASTELYQSEDVFFERAGGFPAFTEKHIPRSEVAQRYTTHGAPMLEDYAPYWVASFFDTAWVGILALIAVLYPLLRMVPSYRKTMFDIGASFKYDQIFTVARESETVGSIRELDALEQTHRQLTQEVEETWVPKGCNQSYYFLVGSLELAREKLDFARARLLPGSPVPGRVGSTQAQGVKTGSI